IQLRLERNYGEAVRLLHARLAQVGLDSGASKATWEGWLAFAQRLAGDTAGAKVTPEQAREAIQPVYTDQKEGVVAAMSLAHAAMGEKDSALKLAERAMTLLPRGKDAMSGPQLEENLALIQTIVGENSRAISTLTQLLHTPYWGWTYMATPITP